MIARHPFSQLSAKISWNSASISRRDFSGNSIHASNSASTFASGIDPKSRSPTTSFPSK